jgi:hypothetical protein
MLADTGSLSGTVSAMRPMVPAKDFDTSKQFYIDLGFQPRPLADRLVEMRLGVFSFDGARLYLRCRPILLSEQGDRDKFRH